MNEKLSTEGDDKMPGEESTSTFVITLRPLIGPGWGTAPEQRLRHALKKLYRNFGLRCLACVTSPETQTNHERKN